MPMSRVQLTACGTGVPKHQRTIEFALSVDGIDVEWTLGAFLVEQAEHAADKAPVSSTHWLFFLVRSCIHTDIARQAPLTPFVRCRALWGWRWCCGGTGSSAGVVCAPAARRGYRRQSTAEHAIELADISYCASDLVLLDLDLHVDLVALLVIGPTCTAVVVHSCVQCTVQLLVLFE